MIKIRLSDRLSRLLCLTGDLLLLCAVIILLLQASWGSRVFFAVLCGFLLLILSVYSITIFSSALLIDNENKRIQLVVPLQRQVIDAADAASVSTRAIQLEHKTTRMIVIRDALGTELCTIPSFSIYDQGSGNEFIAEKLAQALGIAFIPSPDLSSCNKKARKKKDAACQTAKNNGSRKRPHSQDSYFSLPDEKQSAVPLDSTADEVNYDELDDLK